MPIFNKDLAKAIMTRTKLHTIFLQDRTEESRIRYRKQRNFCVSLLRKTKRRYYENLNEKSVTDNKLFWKNVKPFLSDKIIDKDETHLTENNELVKTDIETAEVLNHFFSNVVQNLNISRYPNGDAFVNSIKDPTLRAIFKYKNHTSIISILSKRTNKETFNFTEVDNELITKEILNLSSNKASQSSDIPIKIVKENVDIYSNFFSTSFNSSIKTVKAKLRG